MTHNNLHTPLLNKIEKFKKQTLPKDLIIYHGCREFSSQTDYINKSLTGTRKWFSQDYDYACFYTRQDPPSCGKKLIWKCRLKLELLCLEGSQNSLKDSTPWKESEFPDKFPNEYHHYAKKIINSDQTIGLLDHYVNNAYREILIPNHNEVIDILEVIVV